MKKTILTLIALLPLLAAADAAAQIAPIHFAAPVNPVAGYAKLPVVTTFPGPGFSLPGLTPPMTFPGDSAIPAYPTYVLPVLAPVYEGPRPATPMRGGSAMRVLSARENPFTSKVSAPQDSSKERFDDVFDGSASKPAPVKPVVTGRRITLPEQDLERELGL